MAATVIFQKPNQLFENCLEEKSKNWLEVKWIWYVTCFCAVQKSSISGDDSNFWEKCSFSSKKLVQSKNSQ